MTVKVRTSLDEKHLYNFLMHHIYFSFLGVVGIAISIFAVISAVTTYGKVPVINTLLYIFIAMLFFVFQPVTQKLNAARQLKNNPAIWNKIEYTFTEKNFTIARGKEKETHKWSEIYKITETSISVLVYMSKRNALILPKDKIENIADFKALAQKNQVKVHLRVK